MQVHDEFSGTITLTENSSRELFKVLKEQDEAFINDVLDGRCGFILKSADGRSVELVPNTNKRCQCVGSVGADHKTENSSEKPNNCENCRWWDGKRCHGIGRQCDYKPKDEPQTEDLQDWKDRMWAEAIVTEPQPTTDCRQTDCYMCKWLGDVDVCGRCRNRNLFCEAEPQPRCPKCGKRGYIRSLESMGVKLKVFDEYKWKCTNCNKYFKEEPKDETQYDFGEYADRLWKIAYERGKREALEQTEPTSSKMEQVETMSCAECKHRPIGAEICEEPCHYEPQTDWHYDEQDATWYPYKHEDDPQQKSCATCKHALGNWDGESNNCGRCCGADRRFYEPKDEPQTCSFSDCDNFKNPDYERCIECKRKQIKLKTEQTERSE